MNRYVRDNRPNVRPVEKIDLNESKIKRRGILAAFFACIGIAALVYGFVNLVGGAEPGWETIEAKSASTLTCAGDLLFQYRLGEGTMSASAEKKALQEAYTKAAEWAYWMFCKDDLSDQDGLEAHTDQEENDHIYRKSDEGSNDRIDEKSEERNLDRIEEGNNDKSNDRTPEKIHNIWYINRHPGEAVCVDAALYHAFEKIQDSGNRLIYLGPVYQIYDDLFYCQSDDQAKEFDPYVNEEAADRYAKFAAYASDKSAVNLELLGNRKVRLIISDEYRAFAESEGSTNYLDFFWMKNAFIIDYLAETLEKQGYRKGILTSFDGFSRVFNSGASGDEIDIIKSAHNIYDYQEANKTVYPAAVMEYEGAVSIVSFRDYMRNEQDRRRMYEYEDGVTRTSYLGLEDGCCKSAMHDLTVSAKERGCADILLSVVSFYLTSWNYQNPDTENSESEGLESGGANSGLEGLASEGMYAVWCENRIVYYTDPEVEIKSLFKNKDIEYQVKHL